MLWNSYDGTRFRQLYSLTRPDVIGSISLGERRTHQGRATGIFLKVVSSIREFEGMGVWKVVFWVSFKLSFFW